MFYTGMTDNQARILRREITEKAMALNNGKQMGYFKFYTEEDKKRDEELAIREMVISCEVYGGSYYYDGSMNKYLKDGHSYHTMVVRGINTIQYFKRHSVINTAERQNKNKTKTNQCL